MRNNSTWIHFSIHNQLHKYISRVWYLRNTISSTNIHTLGKKIVDHKHLFWRCFGKILITNISLCITTPQFILIFKSLFASDGANIFHQHYWKISLSIDTQLRISSTSFYDSHTNIFSLWPLFNPKNGQNCVKKRCRTQSNCHQYFQIADGVSQISRGSTSTSFGEKRIFKCTIR